MRVIHLTVAIVAVLCVAAPQRSRAADAGSTALMLEEPARYGVYYDQYEPAFYTGFAPRTFDPARIHVHLGRGNQLRVTLVLADDVLRDYARDLLERQRTYQTLISDGQLVPTQNRAFDVFQKRCDDAQLAQLVAAEASLSSDALRERNLRLLQELNPGRVFRIRMSVDELLRRWLAQVHPEDHTRMDARRRLELVNLMLPTRLFLADVEPAAATQLEALIKSAPDGPPSPATLDALRPAFVRLFEQATHGIYPVRDGVVQFDEFTAIYPVGTFNEYTSYHGRQIPEYPTPGRRALTTHQRTLTVDHVPEDDTYSYFPWLPYMHVGTRLHNAIHTLFWQMKPAETPFLPAEWRAASGDGAPYRYLWLLSRGPMSHGCTHLNAGHISELRQMLPADSERLSQVDMFLNTSPLYDVFDIDGDFQPEVMGVRYFIAYSLKDNKPDRLRARNERHAYYEWLYGGELEYDGADHGIFRGVKDGHFVGHDAVDGTEYDHIPLREADYEPEKVQFYRLVSIPFARELRKVGLHHTFSPLEKPVVSAR